MTKGQIWYHDHLDSKWWLHVKKEVAKRYQYKCSMVGCDRKKNLHFHHLNYDNLGTDREVDDVRIVCSTHHTLCHYDFLGRRIDPNRRDLSRRYRELKMAYWRRTKPSDIIGKLVDTFSIN